MRVLLIGILAFGLALFLGIGSALYAIRFGVPYATTRSGPWISWPGEGHPDADPYTRAYLARSGRLPVTSTTVRYFFATTDQNGRDLTSSCDYELEGGPLAARWWSIALYDGDGGLIANPSDRYSLNSAEMLRRSDGSYHLALARNARPENWLPAGTAPHRKLQLVLRVYDTQETNPDGIGQIDETRLPRIERLSCG